VEKEQSTVSIQGYTGFGRYIHPSTISYYYLFSGRTFHFTKPVDHRATNNFLNKIKKQVSSPDAHPQKKKKRKKLKKRPEE
jgi:hypothetical protein